MNKDDIIRMAREAGCVDPMVFLASYERFAALVAAAKREWQGLTDAEIDNITTKQWGRDFMVPAAGRAWGRAIEAALKEKNG